MTERQQQIAKNVELHRPLILEAERWLWAHPETGYAEWESHAYMKEKLEAMGYELRLAGNIPGFYTDVDTGRKGPRLCLMAELDALDLASHCEAVNGMAHACGHHGQMAALLGIAAALKEPGALDGLCGSVRLMVVPAEELIQIGFREELRQKGVIGYMGGKVEFMHRGFFDGVDLALMIHGDSADQGGRIAFNCGRGMNGCIAKTYRFKGKAAHAGGAPHNGINAQYAAALGLQACNNLRETFQEKDTVRFHPILMGAGCAVNIIPDEMKIETFVRAGNMEAMIRENNKVNRAMTGAALAMGAGVEICDRPGYAPELHDRAFMELCEECCADLVGREAVNFNYSGWNSGSSDFGDLTCVMPGVQIFATGASGTPHGIDFRVTDAERMCVNAAKAQLLIMDRLLETDGAKAKEIIDGYTPVYPSIAAYFEAMDRLFLDKDAVIYHDDGSVTVDYTN